MVWGLGETPIEQVRPLLKQYAREKDWPKYVDIEIGYPIKTWSSPLKETRTFLTYARYILRGKIKNKIQ